MINNFWIWIVALFTLFNLFGCQGMKTFNTNNAVDIVEAVGESGGTGGSQVPLGDNQFLIVPDISPLKDVKLRVTRTKLGELTVELDTTSTPALDLVFASIAGIDADKYAADRANAEMVIGIVDSVIGKFQPFIDLALERESRVSDVPIQPSQRDQLIGDLRALIQAELQNRGG